MRLGSGRSLASVSKGSSSASASASARAFTTTPLRGAVKVNPVATDPDVANTRQAQRPRTCAELAICVSHDIIRKEEY